MSAISKPASAPAMNAYGFWITTSKANFVSNADAIGAGDAGSDTSTSCNPNGPSARYTSVPSTARPSADPGESQWPISRGLFTSPTSTTCTPSVPAATYAREASTKMSDTLSAKECVEPTSRGADGSVTSKMCTRVPTPTNTRAP